MITNFNQEKKILLASEYIRIISTIIILYFFNIPIFCKILLIMIFDKLDCSHMSYPFKGPLFSNNVNICKTLFYQKSDKITDSICYTILLFYILNNGDLSSKYNNLIIILFIFRLIGSYFFLIKNDRKYLFYFPNFFLEICLGLVVINYFSILDNYKEFIILGIIIYKIIQEYYLHVKKYDKIINEIK